MSAGLISRICCIDSNSKTFLPTANSEEEISDSFAKLKNPDKIQKLRQTRNFLMEEPMNIVNP